VRSPRFPALLLSIGVIPAAIATPVLTLPRPHTHAVPAVVRMLDLLSAAAPDTTQQFSLVGANWPAGAVPAGAQVEVRVRQAGTWSDWSALAPADGGPDTGSLEASRAAGRVDAEPLWVGHADGVQARVVRGSTALTLRGIRLALVDPGASNADSTVSASPAASTAMASTVEPRIYTRADWGADESLRRSACPAGPDYSDTIKVGFVHHTDTPNGYSSSQVPSIIRSIYAYHVKSNGWCDIGYNFLIDRFGRIWEGRYGGISKAVIGAHTGGFNTDSFGVAAIGTYTTTQPSSGMLSAYESLFSWKLGLYFRDPTGTDHLVSSGGGTDKWPVGQSVLFHRIAGHRDAGNTTCPGSDLYSKLPTIRTIARSRMGVIPHQSGDFTGDQKTDPATWDPATQNWHVGRLSSSTHWGVKGDIPVAGDYNGDGRTDLAIWRPSNGRWYVDLSGYGFHTWGVKGDIPVPGDYNGDGKTDLAIWRPSDGKWYVDLAGRGAYVWGVRGDVPVPGDYNGDGTTEYAIWRPSNGRWYVYLPGYGFHTWGLKTDIPVPADYDGDGRDDLAVWRSSQRSWYVHGIATPMRFGLAGDVPTPGGYAGSAEAQLSVYRPSTGMWYVSGQPSAALGSAGFEPLVLPYGIYQAMPHGS
jgi:hypothetical protein